MNALSIAYEEERSFKKYCSRIPNSYWVMRLVCNGEVESVCKGGGEGGSRKPHSKNLHSHFPYVSSTKLTSD
jgi:hypothetical protein